jgi:hypothetical protein
VGPTAFDSGSNGLNGAYNGDVTPGGAMGVNGRPVPSFSGVSGFVSIASAAALNITGDLTIEQWINVPDRAAYRGLVSKATSVGAAKPYDSYLNTSDGRSVLAAGPSGSSGVGVAVSTGGALHLVQVRSGALYEEWINGVLVASVPSPFGAGAAPAGTDLLLIGRRADGATQFKGQLYEVALYAARLTGTRIAAHYAARGA